MLNRLSRLPSLALRNLSTRASRNKPPAAPLISSPPTTIRLRDFPALPPSPHTLPLTLQTASQSEIVQHRVNLALTSFQRHATDCGSPQVQIAVATEKILNLARHCASNRKDKHSGRGFQMLVSRRKRMMKYLKRTDFGSFKETVTRLGLDKEAGHL